MKSLLALAVLACFISHTATAQTRTTWTSGAWSAFEGQSHSGRRVCGVATAGSERFLAIKYFAGSNHLTVQVMKDSWAIPRGTRVQVELQFLGETPWTVTGFGDGKIVEMRVLGQAMGVFMREFRGASGGIVRFLGGNEAPWAINLAGSDAASGVMMRCVRAMIGAPSERTQPFGAPPGVPTQPFAPAEPEGRERRQRPAPPAGPGLAT